MTARQLRRVSSLWPNHGHGQSEPPDRTREAPCRRNPELWFSEDEHDTAEAKRICMTVCSPALRVACRQAAEEYGVWGGVAREDRISKPCVTCGDMKLLANFPRHPDSIDGHQPVCGECLAKRLPSRDVCVALLEAELKRRREALIERVNEFARLVDEYGRDEATRMLKITPRTAQRYLARLREPQEVAA